MVIVIVVVIVVPVVTVVTTKNVIIKCEKCVFFLTKNQIHDFFFGFENEYKKFKK